MWFFDVKMRGCPTELATPSTSTNRTLVPKGPVQGLRVRRGGTMNRSLFTLAESCARQPSLRADAYVAFDRIL